MSSPDNRATSPTKSFPPRSIKVANRIIKSLTRLGAKLPMQVLTVPGRRSGQPRSTPVTPYEVDGQRYIAAGLGQSDWVRNVRAAGEGTLHNGRRSERVRLVELPESERGPILREFPKRVPKGVAMFRKAGTVDAPTPDAFAAAAGRCTVFRVESL